jgi:hypothetical protein
MNNTETFLALSLLLRMPFGEGGGNLLVRKNTGKEESQTRSPFIKKLRERERENELLHKKVKNFSSCLSISVQYLLGR